MGKYLIYYITFLVIIQLLMYLLPNDVDVIVLLGYTIVWCYLNDWCQWCGYVYSRSRSPLSVCRVLFVCTFVIILVSLYYSFVMCHSSVNLTTHGLFFHFVLSPQILVWDKYTLYVILLSYTFCLFKFAIVFSYSYLNVTYPLSDGDISWCVEN